MKRTVFLLALCCVLLLSSVAPVWAASAAGVGDIDGDGILSSTDAHMVAHYAVKKEAPIPLEDPALADVDGDGEVTITDARLLMHHYSGDIADFSDASSKDGGALPADFLSFSEPWSPRGDNEICVRVQYNTAAYLMDGVVYIAYPADQVELVVEEMDGPWDPYNRLSDLRYVQVNPAWEEGVIALGHFDPKGLAPGSGNFITLTFRAKKPEATTVTLSAWSDHMSVIGEDRNPAHTLRYTGSREQAVTTQLDIPAVDVTFPTQRVYAVGEDLNLEGGCITYTYPNGETSTEEIHPAKVSGFDSSTPGVKTVTITCGGFTFTYEIEVVEPFIVYIGDVDLDGELTSTDARIVLQYYAGKFTREDIVAMYGEEEGAEEVFCYLADADEDWELTSTDARLILQYYAGKL